MNEINETWYGFVFRNKETGELKQALATSLARAARYTGLGYPLPVAWMAWECWQVQRCIWHYTEEGVIAEGGRE